jgi:bacteriocin biosynthesis cyclodehydratase domain-containing protein
MVEQAGVLHFYDGRRLVSIDTDESLRAAIVTLTHLTDSHAPPPEICTDVDLDPHTLRQLLDTLTSAGLLEQAEAGSASSAQDMPPATVTFASALTSGRVSRAQTQLRLDEATIHVVSPEPDELCTELASHGLRANAASIKTLGQLDPASSIVIAEAGTDGDLGALIAVNHASLDRGFSWLPIGGYDGEVVRVGPFTIPGSTACFACTLSRLAANVEYSEQYYDVVLAVPAAPVAPCVRRWAHAVACLSLLRWITAKDAAIPGTIHTLVPRDLSIRSATVFAVPRCPTCRTRDYLPAAAPWETARVD